MPIDLLDPADIAPLDRPKAQDALARFRLERVESPESPAFDAAYDMLASYFLALGELEDRAALADFVRRGVIDFAPGLEGHYHLITAWDGDALAGVRDCYVDLDLEREQCVVALSHAYVAPAYRRGGLAALLRTAPLSLARATALRRFGRAVPTLVVAEMEAVDPEIPATVIRLVAYGRSGFSVLDPRRLPYSQPEFRALPDAPWTALPFLGVVRADDQSALPVELVAAFPRLFHACHRLYLPTGRVDPSEQHALRALRAAADPVPLLPLPTSVDDLDRLEPLLIGHVLPLYPPTLRGPRPGFGDPAEEMARLRARWR